MSSPMPSTTMPSSIVSNGDRARYGSITSEWDHFAEWKRLDEGDKGNVEAEVLLNGMLAHERLLDIVQNFILFDESKAGTTRKMVARNHRVLGVNRAVASVAFILDKVFDSLPSPPFTTEEKNLVAGILYAHIWRQAMSGGFARAA